MKKLILLIGLILSCQILTCQNMPSYPKNVNLDYIPYIPSHPKYNDTIILTHPIWNPSDYKVDYYIDSSYWGRVLTYPENIELPKLQYDFEPIVPEKRWRLSEPVKVILIFSSSVILEAIGDAKYDEGQKEIGKLYQAMSVGILVASPFLLDIDRSKWAWYFASYISMRIALFDPFYNLTRGLPMGYIGNTSFWDKGINYFDPPEGIKVFGHSLALIVAISIPINHF